MENNRPFSNNLKHYMTVYDTSAKKLSDDLGLSAATISYWLSGKKYPTLENIERLADYFHVQMTDLIDDHANKTRVDPQTIEARIISTGIDKMTKENREKALRMMRIMFAEFNDSFNDEE